MKTSLTRILTLCGMTLLTLASCKKNDAIVTSDGGKAGALTATSTTLVLDKTRLNDPSAAVTFSTTVPKYSFKASYTATLQIDSAGDNWQKPQSVAFTTSPTATTLSVSFSTSDFNTLLLKILKGNVASNVNVRVAYALSSTEVIYSNVVNMTLTPFNLTSWIWVVGDFEGWNNGGGGLDSLVSATGNGIYTGIVNIPAGGTLQFKLLPTKGSWTGAFGDGGSGSLSTSGGNLTAPTPGGQILITADLNKKTVTMAQADYYSLIGSDFTGQNWDHDNYMKFVNDGNNNWVLTLPMIAPSGGGFKIRQDAQWSNSWGLSSTNGVLTDSNGGNISISAAGTYKVTFTMAPSVYGSAPVTLAPYTLTKQ